MRDELRNGSPGGNRGDRRDRPDHCPYCTGELCYYHGLWRCQCDTAERHGEEPCSRLPESEPEVAETIWGPMPIGG